MQEAFDSDEHRSGCIHVYGLFAQHSMAAGPDEVRQNLSHFGRWLVLDGLQNHLMRPDHVALFCQEYTRQMNRLHRENNAARGSDRSALKKIDRNLDRLVQALLDGVSGSRVKDKITALEAEKARLEAKLNEGADNTVLLHPNMAGRSREQITTLCNSSQDGALPEARELIRQLIDRVVLTPVDKPNGRKALSIDLHGHIAGILALATNAKKPPVKGGFSVLYTKLVAGAGFEPTTFRL